MLFDALDAFLKEKEMAGKTGAENPSYMATLGNMMGAKMLDKTGLDRLGVEGANPQMQNYLNQMNNPQMFQQNQMASGMLPAPQPGLQPGQAVNVDITKQDGKMDNMMKLLKMLGGM